jgi:hypothetical protein
MKTEKIKFNTEDVIHYAVSFFAEKDEKIKCDCAVINSSENLLEIETFDFMLGTLKEKLGTSNVAILSIIRLEGE